jgi:hypothetical protein
MNEKQVYAYAIPDSFFLPHKVTRTFWARVKYTVVNNEVKIEEVGLSIKCLKYINNTEALTVNIENELNKQVKKATNLSNMHPIFAAALAPHI